ncbi:MAG: hypothetical protein ACFFCI_00695 [Promethearchaeota archaeon]
MFSKNNKLIDWLLYSLMIFLLVLLFLMGSANVYFAVFQPYLLMVSPFASLIGALLCYLFVIFFIGLLIGDYYKFGWKKVIALIFHKLLDWRVIRNPLTDRWYPELYRRKD